MVLIILIVVVYLYFFIKVPLYFIRTAHRRYIECQNFFTIFLKLSHVHTIFLKHMNSCKWITRS